MRISVTSPLRDPHYRPPPPMMSEGDGYWRSTPIPPPPGFPNHHPVFWSPPPPPPPGFQDRPIFWSPPPAPPLYYGPPPSATLLRRPHFAPQHYFVDAQRPSPTTGYWRRAPLSPRPPPSPTTGYRRRTLSPRPPSPTTGNRTIRGSRPRVNSVAAPVIVGQKRPRGRPPGTGRRQNIALQRSPKRSPSSSSVSAPKSPCAGDSMVSSSNVPLIVLKTKLTKLKNANRKDLEKTSSMAGSEMSCNVPLNILMSKMIRTRKGKRKAQLENSALGATMDRARTKSLKYIYTRSSTQALQRSSNGSPSSVSAPKSPCAGDSTVSSSNVPLNVLMTKLSKIKKANREALEKTACVGHSEISSRAPLSLLISKMIRARKGKRKAQLENSALGATMDMERENSLNDISTTILPQDVHEEEIQAQALVDQLRTEGPKGKTVVEQAQQVDLTGQTEKVVPNGDHSLEGPTETDDIVAEILQHDPQLLETASTRAVLADTNETAARRQLHEITNENMTSESDQEVDRRERRRPSHPDCQSGSSVEVAQYSVHPSLTPTLEAIINKYGDIAKDSICESNSVQSTILESICRVLQGLNIPAKHLTRRNFDDYYTTVQNAEKVGVNVKWLLQGLDKHLATVHMVAKCKDVRDAMKKNTELRDTTKKAVEQKKDDIKELNLEIQELENQLSSMNTSEIEKLKSDMAASASKIKSFRTKGLMEGLF